MVKVVFAFILLHLVFASVTSLNPPLNDDILGLIVFKADVIDPNGRLVSWTEDDTSPCNWVGVNCNPRSNRVSEVVLDGFALSGKIGRGLLQLQFLSKLSLAKNNLTGTVIPSITQLENLRVLDLSENGLSGSIPGEFFQQCGLLRSISLARNKFTGNIPDSLSSCSTLISVNFSGNQLSGLLPSGIWSLRGLRSIDLSDNVLEGEIPKGMEKSMNLRAINFQRNQLTGNIPDGIGSCLLLRSLNFGENSLSGNLPSTMRFLTLCNNLNLRKNAFVGEVPEWIGDMRSLETLDLSGNSFSGMVPNSVGNLQSVKVLNFSRNGFTGTLPGFMINCKNLLVVDFSHNSLMGGLPVWILQIGVEEVLLSGNRLSGSLEVPFSSLTEDSRKNLVVLDLSSNSLSGKIPSAVGDFSSLRVLNLSVNSLDGSIPASVGKLKALEDLDLSENRLDGNISMEIGGAVSLKELNLAKNSLTGIIPTSIQNCSSINSLILSGNDITGPIPVALAKLTNLQMVDLSFNKLTGTLPKQLTNLNHLLSFNISHNQLQGELPSGGFFNTIPPSSVAGNPSLCGAVVDKTCPTVLPKPIVLDPNSTDSTPGSIPQTRTRKKTILSISVLVAIGAAALIFVGVIAITVLNLRVRTYTSHSAAALALSGSGDFSQKSPTTNGSSGKLVMFSGEPNFSTGAHALLNKNCELGRGGFGAVYRTVLRDGRSVAIKKLTVSSLVKSQDDFEKEVKKLGKIRHPNVVALEGYYWTPSLQLLIYEFVSGGSLYKHLHKGSNGNFLLWNERLSIILAMAKSLAHLHQMNIIHYNLKSSNILMDDDGDPKLADFGLARLLPMLDRYVLSSKIQSALGYMAPEFACKTVKITEKCDVYGFGVLVLEVVTGKKPVEYMEDDVVVLCDVVRGALEEGRVEECVDSKLEGNFPADEAIPVMKLGLICTSQVPSNRPGMGEVVNILELIRCPSEGQEELI